MFTSLLSLHAASYFANDLWHEGAPLVASVLVLSALTTVAAWRDSCRHLVSPGLCVMLVALAGWHLVHLALIDEVGFSGQVSPEASAEMSRHASALQAGVATSILVLMPLLAYVTRAARLWRTWRPTPAHVLVLFVCVLPFFWEQHRCAVDVDSPSSRAILYGLTGLLLFGTRERLAPVVWLALVVIVERLELLQDMTLNGFHCLNGGVTADPEVICRGYSEMHWEGRLDRALYGVTVVLALLSARRHWSSPAVAGIVLYVAATDPIRGIAGFLRQCAAVL